MVGAPFIVFTTARESLLTIVTAYGYSDIPREGRMIRPKNLLYRRRVLLTLKKVRSRTFFALRNFVFIKLYHRDIFFSIARKNIRFSAYNLLLIFSGGII